jgi:hypothetical protein
MYVCLCVYEWRQCAAGFRLSLLLVCLSCSGRPCRCILPVKFMYVCACVFVYVCMYVCMHAYVCMSRDDLLQDFAFFFFQSFWLVQDDHVAAFYLSSLCMYVYVCMSRDDASMYVCVCILLTCSTNRSTTLRSTSTHFMLSNRSAFCSSLPKSSS